MIDLHNDALLKLPPRKLLPYLRQAKADGVDEIWLSVWTTELPNPLATIKSKRQLLDQIYGNPDYPICRLHIEDAWFLTPDNLETLIALRPHSVGLTWNAANNLGGGAHSRAGITRFGYQVIKRLESAGIQIDTAHLNRRSFWEFARVTTRPMVCTHTAFNSMRRHPRNLTKRQIQAIIQSGGMVGICLVADFLSSNTTSCGIHHLLKHIMYYKQNFGLSSLRLGTDFYGTEHLPYGINSYVDLEYIFQARVLGYSVLHQPIVGYQIGNPTASKRILVTGSMHAREWITGLLIKKFMHHHTDLPSDVLILYIPNCNPDGVRLVQEGLSPFFYRQSAFLRQVNHQANNFNLWKANARAVDLNVNFNASWGHGKQNLTIPAPANYIGPRPHSEPENRTLLRAIKHFRPTVSLAFHSKGDVIYYSRIADRPVAKKLAELCQYQPKLSVNSYGGLTDYLALKLNIPAFTIEVGADKLKHPIGGNHLDEIWARVNKLLAYFFNGA